MKSFSSSPEHLAVAEPAMPPEITELTLLAHRGLAPMLDEERQLFCKRFVRTQQGMAREGLSLRYTMMVLLGLHELETSGTPCAFDRGALYEAVLRNAASLDGLGDLGLLIWLTAVTAPDRLESLLSTFDLENALDRYPDARDGKTMELSWFLAGLAHAVVARPSEMLDRTDVAVRTYCRLQENRGKDGLFGHLKPGGSVEGYLRGRIGSFADQVYPIYAYSKFATSFHWEEPLHCALECADSICRLQGELGQWWWLYDTRSGRVSSYYPVYSVHQHAMAPMALFAVQKASGRSFRAPIAKGLQWISGSNELGVDMRDASNALIWRRIAPRWRHQKHYDMALNFVRPSNQTSASKSLEVLFETWPYELGWLLYALANCGVNGNSVPLAS